jgi:hypothetical protein
MLLFVFSQWIQAGFFDFAYFVSPDMFVKGGGQNLPGFRSVSRIVIKSCFVDSAPGNRS